MKSSTPDLSYALRTDDNEPDVTAMVQALQDAATHATDEVQRMVRDENTRYCWWPDQSDTGRKPNLVNGQPAEPWPAASDVRVRLADQLVNDEVRMSKAAARRAKLTVRGTESGDMRDAGKVQLYLDHLRNTRLAAMNKREVELAAQWRATHGKAITAICWHQEYGRDFVPLTREMLEQAAMQAQVPDSPPALLLAALDPAANPDVVEAARALLGEQFPDARRGDIKAALDALARGEEASLPQRYLRMNEPRREALKLWHDVFLPANTEDVQRAPWIAWRRTFTPAEVREKALSEGWDDAAVEAVLATVGLSLLDVVSADSSRAASRREQFRDTTEEMDELCEVFYFYHTASDEHGVPVKYLTVMSPHAASMAPQGGEPVGVCVDEPLGYDHGLYPFVAHRRERPDRVLIASRGIPELVLTTQAEVKHTRDARINQTDLVLQPPVIRPEREVGLPLSLRPRGEIGERKGQQTREMRVANTAPAGEPLEMAALRDAAVYFARNRNEDGPRVALYEQDLADDFCDEEAEVWRHILKLCQQYEDEMVFQRIVGGKPSRITLTREEIQGEYDIQLFYNTDTLDPERMKAKIEIFSKFILPQAQGEIDVAVINRGLMAYYFPEFADAALRDNEFASSKEVEDEELNWTRMVGNIEPAMREEGMNFGLRLQWLEQQIGKPESMQLMQSLPYLEPLVRRRLEHLRFMVQQKTTNAQAGRVGVVQEGGA
jgi:hypothetical protein